MKPISARQIAVVFTGSFLGAGFLSGQELLQFFGVFGGFGLVGMALAILAGLVLLLAAGYGLWRCQRTYTPDKWASAPDERLDILGDLLERYDLVGMTEEEVVALLGPEDGPEQTSFKGDRTYYPPEDTLVYYLGVGMMDGVWLVISLEDGVVTGCATGIT